MPQSARIKIGSKAYSSIAIEECSDKIDAILMLRADYVRNRLRDLFIYRHSYVFPMRSGTYHFISSFYSFLSLLLLLSYYTLYFFLAYIYILEYELLSVAFTHWLILSSVYTFTYIITYSFHYYRYIYLRKELGIEPRQTTLLSS